MLYLRDEMGAPLWRGTSEEWHQMEVWGDRAFRVATFLVLFASGVICGIVLGGLIGGAP